MQISEGCSPNHPWKLSFPSGCCSRRMNTCDSRGPWCALTHRWGGCLVARKHLCRWLCSQVPPVLCSDEHKGTKVTNRSFFLLIRYPKKKLLLYGEKKPQVYNFFDTINTPSRIYILKNKVHLFGFWVPQQISTLLFVGSPSSCLSRRWDIYILDLLLLCVGGFSLHVCL